MELLKKPQDFKDFVNTDIVGLRKMLLEWLVTILLWWINMNFKNKECLYLI